MTIIETLSQENVVSATIYTPKMNGAWDSFVSASKNATFLFQRNYMDYHNDRFVDHSLMFNRNNQLVALLPANINGDVLYTHAGLTSGGVISGFDMTTPLLMLQGI